MTTVASEHYRKLLLAGAIYLFVAALVAVVFSIRGAEIVAASESGTLPAATSIEYVDEAPASRKEVDDAPIGGERDAGGVDTGALVQPAVRIISRTARRVIL